MQAPAPLLIRDIAYGDPFAAFRRFADLPGAVFLDSALAGAPFGRYSFIAADPFLTLASRDGRITCGGDSWEGDPFAALDDLLGRFRIEAHPGLPPFQGGVVAGSPTISGGIWRGCRRTASTTSRSPISCSAAMTWCWPSTMR